MFLRDNGFTAPMYSVMGNHDHDGARLADAEHPDITRYAEEPWREAFGPTYYSMNIGNDHWVMLDNILYYNEAPPREGEGKYGMKGNRRFVVGLTEGQFAWLEKDLAMVPAGRHEDPGLRARFLHPPGNHRKRYRVCRSRPGGPPVQDAPPLRSRELL